MTNSLEDHIVELYRRRANPPLGHFRRILDQEEGIKLPSKTLKSYLLKASITHPISSNRRINRPIRRAYNLPGPDYLWVCSILNYWLYQPSPIPLLQECDLAFIRSASGRTYSIIVTTDVFSSFVFARLLPGRRHTADVAAKAFRDIVQTSGRKPYMIQVSVCACIHMFSLTSSFHTV